jgi:hypothetical protein
LRKKAKGKLSPIQIEKKISKNQSQIKLNRLEEDLNKAEAKLAKNKRLMQTTFGWFY